VYSEPVLKAFEAKTGIHVDAVYDVEASKVTGLANRLVAESERPKADVFWNGEFVQTLRLKAKGVLQPYRSPLRSDFPPSMLDPEGYWNELTPRLRVWMSAPDFKERNIGLEDLPRTGLPGDQMAVSNPMLGTASTQAAALFAIHGPAAAGKSYQALLDKGVRIVEGNATVRDLVVSGDIKLGLTDTDDACSAIRHGAKARVFYPTETLLIPASVAIIKGAPNVKEAQVLVDFLMGAEAESMLVESGFCQMPVRKTATKPCLALPQPKLLRVRPEQIVDNLAQATEDLRQRFVR
jgi:iron(III) transport system substrate-binding protein